MGNRAMRAWVGAILAAACLAGCHGEPDLPTLAQWARAHPAREACFGEFVDPGSGERITVETNAAAELLVQWEAKGEVLATQAWFVDGDIALVAPLHGCRFLYWCSLEGRDVLLPEGATFLVPGAADQEPRPAGAVYQHLDTMLLRQPTLIGPRGYLPGPEDETHLWERDQGD